ncbi:MAG: Uma2 family endonuclease, partial [Myxococcota bacterium]
MQPHPPTPRPRSIQTWRRGHYPPRLAIEIVSTDWRKDYDDNPPKYAQIGVEELLIFDPDAARNPPLPGLEQDHERVALQLYQQHPQGGLVCTERGQGPMFSEVLQAWLLVVSTPAGPRLRLGYGPTEDALVPSSPEALDRSRDHLRCMQHRLEQALVDYENELQARVQAERQREEAEHQRGEAERQREKSLHALRASLALAEAAGADPVALATLQQTLRSLEAEGSSIHDPPPES